MRFKHNREHRFKTLQTLHLANLALRFLQTMLFLIWISTTDKKKAKKVVRMK